MAANTVESVDATAAVKTSPDKFYNFFKYNMSDLVKVAPLIFTDAQIIEGEEGKVGCVKQWHYLLGAIPMSAKVQLTALDDAARSITYSVLEGDVLVLYKSFGATFVFSEGLAKCTLKFEKATPLSPPPQAYVALAISVFALLDTYLQTV